MQTRRLRFCKDCMPGWQSAHTFLPKAQRFANGRTGERAREFLWFRIYVAARALPQRSNGGFRGSSGCGKFWLSAFSRWRRADHKPGITFNTPAWDRAASCCGNGNCGNGRVKPFPAWAATRHATCAWRQVICARNLRGGPLWGFWGRWVRTKGAMTRRGLSSVCERVAWVYCDRRYARRISGGSLSFSRCIYIPVYYEWPAVCVASTEHYVMRDRHVGKGHRLLSRFSDVSFVCAISYTFVSLISLYGLSIDIYMFVIHGVHSHFKPKVLKTLTYSKTPNWPFSRALLILFFKTRQNLKKIEQNAKLIRQSKNGARVITINTLQQCCQLVKLPFLPSCQFIHLCADLCKICLDLEKQYFILSHFFRPSL